MSDTETTAIEKVETVNNPTTVTIMRPSIIRPIVMVDEALEAWKEYQALKDKLASDGDFVKIGNKMHPTKQFSNKISRFFGLSVSIVKAEKETGDASDLFTWHIWARATAPNGQFRDGDGHCSSKERNFTHLEHDVYATAVTRAKNRAILELAGFGEVSAEEILDDDKHAPTPAPAHAPARAEHKELSAKGKEVREKLGSMLLKMANNDKAEAARLLKQYTIFTTDKGEERYATTLAGMSEKWIMTTYGKVQKDYENIGDERGGEWPPDREPGDDDV